MDAAAPDGAPPRRINLLIKKTAICPAVPRRGPEAGDSLLCDFLTIFIVRV
jgi:hypothetical protein